VSLPRRKGDLHKFRQNRYRREPKEIGGAAAGRRLAFAIVFGRPRGIGSDVGVRFEKVHAANFSL
jgi:hypothetical protein